MTKHLSTRLYWLDILRGLAALSIVLWHWQHFFMHGSFAEQLKDNIKTIHSAYPLYHFLRPFYGQGWRAVQLFFTLSGFIFFWLYSEKIAARKISFGKYIFLRLSRLYPLHWLTLLVVILSQIAIHRIDGSYFIYDNFGVWAFITNFTLTFNWFNSKFAFNGPSWSVSVEMFLYVVFFSICYLKYNRWWSVVIFIAAGYFLRGHRFDQIGSGLMSFFMGGIVCYIYNWINGNISIRLRKRVSVSVFLIMIFTSIFWRYVLRENLPFYFFEICFFPTLILTIALMEIAFGSGVAKKISFVGDISYSSYLWHFPLQIIFVIISDSMGWGRVIFYSPVTLGLFYLMLIIIALISYYFFEHPLQKFLRDKWEKNNTGKAETVLQINADH